MNKSLTLIKSYGLFGTIRLVLNLIVSKLTYPQARIIRRPHYIRNEGTLNIGKGFSSNPGLVIDVFGSTAVMSIGKDVVVNSHVHLGACHQITIGDNVLMASGVYVSDHSHGIYRGECQSHPDIPPNLRQLHSSPVIIGDNCWIGEKVSILPGVSVGQGSIIGAGSVVNTDIPDYAIAVGVPAKVIKIYNFKTDKWVTT